jgi:topoisomerase IA-like protein
MEIIPPYIGKYDGSSVFLNNGKHGPYLNYNDKLYSVPKCFQTPKFNLQTAIKIIDFKNKWSAAEGANGQRPSENKNNELVKGPEDEESNANRIKKIQAATTYEEVDNIVKDIKNKKSLKKSNE